MKTIERAWGTFQRALESEYSSFYRDFYAGKIPHNGGGSEKEWLSVPCLTKSDILKVPYNERIFTPLHDVDMIRYTSGTSGRGVLCLPLSTQSPLSIEMRRLQGKNIVTFFHHHHVHTRSFEGSKNAPARIIAGDTVQLAATAKITMQIEADSLHGPTSVILSFTPYIREYSPNIRYIRLTSERTTMLQLRALQAAYPNAEISWAYASAEGAGSSAVSPTTKIPKHPFALEPLSDFYIEIVNERAAPIVEDAEGEIILTTLDASHAFPLIRYRTGDRARVIRYNGDHLIFKVLGRAEEEMVRIGGGEIHLAEIEQAVYRAMGDRVVDFEAEVTDEIKEGRPVPKLVIKLMKDNNSKDRDVGECACIIAESLKVNQDKSYADGVRKGMYAPLSCTLVDLENIQGRKRRHLADRRT